MQENQRPPLPGCTRSQQNLFMDGPAIFTFAITVVPRVVKNLLAKASIAREEIDLISAA